MNISWRIVSLRPQCNSTLEGCYLVKLANNVGYVKKMSAECNEEQYLTILHLSGVELHCKLQQNLHHIIWSLSCTYSLRVSLDMGKVVYSWMISRDKEMPGTMVRSSTIPEELGRIAYLLTDKTGTLTQNEMVCERNCISSYRRQRVMYLQAGI